MKAILFDLDGTLIHTSFECVSLIVNKILRDLNARPPSKDSIAAFWYGTNRNEIIQRVFGTDLHSFWELYQKYHTIEIQKPHTSLYGDLSILGQLKQRGYKLAIVTGALPTIAEYEISLIGESHFDDVTLARASHGSLPKPDPHCINLCLQKFGVSPAQALFVGNADEDILAARNAGVVDVIIDRKECRLTMKPTFAINSLHELPAIIENHSSRDKINKE